MNTSEVKIRLSHQAMVARLEIALREIFQYRSELKGLRALASELTQIRMTPAYHVAFNEAFANVVNL